MSQGLNPTIDGVQLGTLEHFKYTVQANQSC